MSRLFDALRKSEQEAGKQTFDSAETFLNTIAKKQVPLPVVKQQISVRPEHRIVVYTEPHSPASERFRLLRTHLRELQVGARLKVLLVTSALPGEGKTTVALNLATVLAQQQDCRVLLLEADLRCPSLTKQWGLSSWEGLTDCLERDLDPLLSIRRIEPLGIHVLPAGSHVANPAELLQSDRYSRLMQTVVTQFQWIIIDCPPVIPVADTLALKGTADATLLVMRAGHTPRQALEDVIKKFARGQVIGIILNSTEKLEDAYGDYYRQGAQASSVSARKNKSPI